jgi:hypothetical protein
MSAERQILTAPDAIARAAAPMAPEPEQRWMLKQSRELRRSFAADVFGRPDEELRQQVWMLAQERSVRESFAREVLMKADEPQREMIWMLFQDDETCRSYSRYVLEGDDAELQPA